MVAMSDVSPEALNRVAEAQGIKKRYEKSEELIADPKIDIIDICVPNRYHAPLAIAALQAGKHVICEKPLAPTPAEIRQMIQARDKSGKLLMTAQHFRFEGSSRALKAEIDGGALGNIYHARSWMLRRSAAPTRPGFILKQHSGGGPCIDIGVHILDLTLWMMGHPKPVSVTGVTQAKLAHLPGAFSNWGGPIPNTFDVEDFAAAFVRFANGATLVLEVSWLLHHKTTGEDMQMWLYGDKGGSHWPSNEILTTNNGTRQHMNTQLVNAEGGEAHAKECVAFAEALATGKPSPVPAEQSLDVITILDALYRSAEAGREIRLDQEKG
jgi:predicted dehydrogenase